ncbi:1-deoxy-D-xylulose-5-phosphate synthase [Gammaproteobacteria bacterium]
MAEDNLTPLLDRILSPTHLRLLPETDLPALAAELRQFLIQSVGRTGGHLAASLGTVELTIALHYVFHTPDDFLVWDVGHQAYIHKILTGRRPAMETLRRKGGIAGFPRRDESPYDTFGVGHSSTSISAALGMTVAKAALNIQRQVVAIIGDGAMGAGMAFEALNHAGDLNADLLVVLNDNKMSISPNVGALSNYLARILSGRVYATMREGSKRVLSHIRTPVWEFARRAEEHIKGMLVPGTLFEELGFNYIGPIDGHDLSILVRTLRNLRALKGPRLLHVVTTKGKGYLPAEDNPCAYHGVGAFDPDTGELLPARDAGPTYTQIFSDWLCDMAALDERLVGITPAMREGSGLVRFSERYPNRYFDVGIAEQHALTFAAGLACDGLRPVVAVYSTFLQRAYDQLIHDVALQNLPVLLAIDRAGIVGPDGPTHAGAFDLSFLRCIPGLVVMAPADEDECRQMLYTGFMLGAPAAVRYPRGTGPGVLTQHTMTTLPLGRAQIRRKGRYVALLAFGSMVAPALVAAEPFDATVVNMRFVKPLDTELLTELVCSHELLVTIEENAVAGGAGAGVSECLAAMGLNPRLIHLGLPDRFTGQGSRAELLAEYGLDSDGISRFLSGVFRSYAVEK